MLDQAISVLLGLEPPSMHLVHEPACDPVGKYRPVYHSARNCKPWLGLIRKNLMACSLSSDFALLHRSMVGKDAYSQIAGICYLFCVANMI